jgi:hypothetical protein
MTAFGLIYLILYVAGVVAFAIFVSRQEDSTAKTRVWIWVGAVVALLLALFSLLLGGAVMIAACFYVADRKSRSRMCGQSSACSLARSLCWCWSASPNSTRATHFRST